MYMEPKAFAVFWILYLYECLSVIIL